MDETILYFLKKQTAASISCIDEINEPYSFSCFFVFNDRENLLYYKSTIASYHSKILLQNPKVSGTVMPDKLNKLAVKGIQFAGVVLAENDPLCMGAFKNYHTRFPMAVAIPGVVWTIQLNQLKMTDNVPGIFKKHSWLREEKAVIQID
ncbi:MAG: pyridoxamine 5'-phosphate oxidase family protein [Ginsengibacter sp.]